MFSIHVSKGLVQKYRHKLKAEEVETVLLYVFYKTLSAPETKICEFANSVDPDEAAHYESPHLDLHCLPSSL